MPGIFDDLIPGGAAQPAGRKGMFGGGTAAQQAAAVAKAKQYQAVWNQLDAVQNLYDKNLKGVGPGSILEYLPLPGNKAFDSASAGLSEAALAAFRVPGVGAQSDTELRQFVKANQPSASEQDAVNEQRINNIRNRLRAFDPEHETKKSGFKVTRIR